ncbi:MAG: hypothetical protein N2Z76_04505 [Treponemataceae bacterium]|nr:hypothetical protein [Treponemataceae bacterium]
MLSLWVWGYCYGYAVSPKATKNRPAVSREPSIAIQETSPFVDFHVKSRGAIATTGKLSYQFDFSTQIRPLSLLNRGVFFYTWPDWTAPQQMNIPMPNLGLFHGPSGSRLLFGNCTIQGLENRITNPLGKSLSGSFSYRASTATLSSTASPPGEEEWYGKILLSLGSLIEFSSFVHMGFQNFPWGTYGAGVYFLLPHHKTLTLEGLYYRGDVEASKGTSWFSAVPLLPHHPFEVWAGTLWYHENMGSGGFSLAYSSTYFGETGWYVHGVARYTPGPWDFCVVGDGVVGTYRSPGGKLQNRTYRIQCSLGYYPPRSIETGPFIFSGIGWNFVSHIEGNSDTFGLHTIQVSGTVRDPYRRFFLIPRESSFSYKREYTNCTIKDTYSLSITASLTHFQIRNTLRTVCQFSSTPPEEPPTLFKNFSEELTLAYRWHRLGVSATTLWTYRPSLGSFTSEYKLAFSATYLSYSFLLEGSYVSATNTYEATLSWSSTW